MRTEPIIFSTTIKVIQIKLWYTFFSIQSGTFLRLRSGSAKIASTAASTASGLIALTRCTRQYDNVLLAITEDHDDFEVIVPKEKELEKALKKYPNQFDKKIARFLLQFCPEFAYHSQLVDNFQHILVTQRVMDETLRCDHIYKAMVNYNYHLDFRVNRDHLKHIFDEAQGGQRATTHDWITLLRFKFLTLCPKSFNLCAKRVKNTVIRLWCKNRE